MLVSLQSRDLPAVSLLFGIAIQMFWREHAQRLCAPCDEHEALSAIRTLEVVGGYLPRRALSLTVEWAIEHQAELMESWMLCQAMQPHKRIQPLE
jgi:hypothetical protein